MQLAPQAWSLSFFCSHGSLERFLYHLQAGSPEPGRGLLQTSCHTRHALGHQSLVTCMDFYSLLL